MAGPASEAAYGAIAFVDDASLFTVQPVVRFVNVSVARVTPGKASGAVLIRPVFSLGEFNASTLLECTSNALLECAPRRVTPGKGICCRFDSIDFSQVAATLLCVCVFANGVAT